MPYSPKLRNLPTEIAEQAEIIAGCARKEDLDFYETVFEMLDFDEISQVAAYGGFPQRYPHWRFGMEYGMGLFIKTVRLLGHSRHQSAGHLKAMSSDDLLLVDL